ncbi:MAG: DUF559 domain-containing protein [Chloroflexi bacterium]|nr:DUF559 domain-containing protein [Chloroflexota bacterium]
MASPGQERKDIEQYEHRDKTRVNNPPVGLVTSETDPETGKKKTYAYDPHLDPQLIWAGKAEHSSFEVPPVSLHVHERIDPRTIVEAVRKRNGNGGPVQLSLFDTERKEPLREAVEFYKHPHGWSNRLIAGDSLLVMNSLLEKEGMAGKVQMIYIDPPYGIKYGSNFQPFVNKRDVKDGKDEDLTAEPEQIRAYRDTWELGIHSYLTYLRDRLLLARELLSESGSIFVQIGDENVHHVRELMDEVFGAGNFVALITFVTTSSQTSELAPSVGDYVVWYARDKAGVQYRKLYEVKSAGGAGASKYTKVLLESGETTSVAALDSATPLGGRRFRLDTLTSQSGGENSAFAVGFNGRSIRPRFGFWKTNQGGMQRLIRAGRIADEGRALAYIRYIDDFPAYVRGNVWSDFASVQSRTDPKVYVVQTATKVIERCILMTTDPGDLVFDPTCVRKGTGVLAPTLALPAGGEGSAGQPVDGGGGYEQPVLPLSAVKYAAHLPSVGKQTVLPPSTGDHYIPPPSTGDHYIPPPSTGDHYIPPPSTGDHYIPPPSARDHYIPPPSTGEVRRGDAPSAGEIERGNAQRVTQVGCRIVAIDQIQPGNLIFGHDGILHRVLRVIRRPYRGLMIGIRHALNRQTLWLTADHRILCKPRPRTLGGQRDWSASPVGHIERRQQLRREANALERRLWAALRSRQLGFKFRRQHPIGPYIADFYSREAHLVVEVDGATHFEPDEVEYDAQRDTYMRSIGIDVLRFTAKEVAENLGGVCLAIQSQCKLRRESLEGAEWLQAARIQPGDLVFFGAERAAVAVESVEFQYTDEEVYDLEIEDAHSFITEVCVVHNCGSGTTAYVAEKWGRRWITCDTSRVAITLARQRLMAAVFDYYELAHPEEGVGSGFKYKTVPHITLKSIANNPEIDGIYARMHPAIEQALADLNAALKGQTGKFKVTQGGRAGQIVDFAASDGLTYRMPSGQEAPVNALLEWEVPFEFPEDWPEGAREPFQGFHTARRAMQKEMDEAIARHADLETLYDQPYVDRKKVRVSGPFTVEAGPAPAVKSVDELLESAPQPADTSIARSGETLRQAEWRDELLRTGIRGKAEQYMRFARLEPLPGCRWLHAEGETRPSAEGSRTVREEGTAYASQRVVVSFGPEHAPLEQRQVERAIEEAETLVPRPKLVVFAAFQFDPEAAKDIDQTNWPGVTLLKVQMNADLLTDDLKKKRASNESFWLIGQPDVWLERITEGEHIGKWRVAVEGFDYYNTKTGGIESSGKDRIAVWLLDTDYDGRSLFPRQVFFPMAGADEGWAKLARNLKAEIDQELIEAYRGTESLPFEPGEHRRIAVKIVDDRGIESLKVMDLTERG